MQESSKLRIVICDTGEEIFLPKLSPADVLKYMELKEENIVDRYQFLARIVARSTKRDGTRRWSSADAVLGFKEDEGPLSMEAWSAIIEEIMRENTPKDRGSLSQGGQGDASGASSSLAGGDVREAPVGDPEE